MAVNAWLDNGPGYERLKSTDVIVYDGNPPILNGAKAGYIFQIGAIEGHEHCGCSRAGYRVFRAHDARWGCWPLWWGFQDDMAVKLAGITQRVVEHVSYGVLFKISR